MAEDVFGFNGGNIEAPLTADKATLIWGEVVAGAVQVSITYAQQINRRRTIGNNLAVIWAAMPSGQIAIQRLLTIDASALFSSPGWKSCAPGEVTLQLKGGCDYVGGETFTATGCVVSQFSVSAEAESLTVMDNVTIEFLQLAVGT